VWAISMALWDVNFPDEHFGQGSRSWILVRSVGGCGWVVGVCGEIEVAEGSGVEGSGDGVGGG